MRWVLVQPVNEDQQGLRVLPKNKFEDIRAAQGEHILVRGQPKVKAYFRCEHGRRC
jgi:hypothetical protein